MKKVFATITIGCLIAAVASLAQLPKPGSGGGGTSGGTGHATTYGAYASLPGTCSTGDRYFTSDSIYEFLCTATNAWTAFYRGQKVTVPTASGWSWENQGTATADHTYGYIYMTAPASAGASYRMYMREEPSAPYTFTALVRVHYGTTNYAHGGVTVRNDSLADRVLFGFCFETNNSVCSIFMDSDTDTGVAFKGTTRPVTGDERWFRFVDDATNRITSSSLDGVNWVVHLTEGNTVSVTPDQIGFHMNSQNSVAIQMMVISLSIT